PNKTVMPDSGLPQPSVSVAESVAVSPTPCVCVNGASTNVSVHAARTGDTAPTVKTPNANSVSIARFIGSLLTGRAKSAPTDGTCADRTGAEKAFDGFISISLTIAL